MTEIIVLAEHRQGQMRDITFEMLNKARDIAAKISADTTALIFGYNTQAFGSVLKDYAKNVILINDSKFEKFNSDAYKRALVKILGERKPLLLVVGHTSYGIELAPGVAAAMNIPLITDCVDFGFESEDFMVTRQIYGGKVNAKVIAKKSPSYLVTVRQATFAGDKPAQPVGGQVIEIPSPLTEEIFDKRFLQYVLPPPGGVDITAADKLIGIGRGIKDVANVPVAEDLAKTLGAVLACSRPIVDKGWLPNDRQVGTSGKTVKPKLYIALGISGAFQHVLGMKSSDLIIAVNKDPKAPIFNFADYGVVEDLFKIVSALRSKIYEIKTQKASQ